MPDNLLRTVWLLLLGSWCVFCAVAGWRQSLWLLPVIVIGLLALRFSRETPKSPCRPYRYDGNGTVRRHHDKMSPPDQPAHPLDPDHPYRE